MLIFAAWIGFFVNHCLWHIKTEFNIQSFPDRTIKELTLFIGKNEEIKSCKKGWWAKKSGK